ncbi:hypothetical protein MAR_004732 [Mya arenaria]|uniref:Uncharacterized protein n=1 Tax=Mya arenaria TaxID=6604 RepID=A0ABY7EZ51_MYAAR|nr:hypothetical protein MAR_004732 [Mya arenaria]
MEGYNKIRTTIMNNAMVMSSTNLQLPSGHYRHVGPAEEKYLFTSPSNTAGSVKPKRKTHKSASTPLAPASHASNLFVVVPQQASVLSSMPASAQPELHYQTKRYRQIKAKEMEQGKVRRKYTQTKVNRTCKKCGDFIDNVSHKNLWVELRDERALRDNKFQQLIYLWEQLPSFEKKRTNFPRSYTKKQWSGKFRRRRKHVAPGVESITKLSSPRTQPKSSAVAKLQQIHRGRISFLATRSIRDVYGLDDVLSSGLSTTSDRYNKEEKEQEHKILLQGKDMPKPPMTASGLPEALRHQCLHFKTLLYCWPSAYEGESEEENAYLCPRAIRLRSTSTATNYASTRNHNAQISCHNGAAAIVHPSWTTLNPSNIISINNSNNKNTFKKKAKILQDS